MAGPTLATTAFVVLKRPPAETFQPFSVFSAEQGNLSVLQRVSRKAAATSVALDLFDETALILEGAPQGQTWFVKETRLLQRHADIGRDYETLRFASALALLISRNAVPEESRAGIYSLLRQAFTAFGQTQRPDVVYFKSLYLFARDEGYPIKQEWFPTLPAADRAHVTALLGRPLAEQDAPLTEVARLTRRLENYLRGHTDILLD